MTRRNLGQAIPMSTLVMGILPSLREAEVVAEAKVPKLSERTICVVGQAPSARMLDVLRRASDDVRVVLSVEDAAPGSIVISLDGAGVDPWTADLLAIRADDSAMEREFIKRFEAGMSSTARAARAVKTMSGGMLEASRVLGTMTAMAGTVLERSAPPEPSMLYEEPTCSAPFMRFHWAPPAQDADARRDAKRKAQKRARKRQRVR